MRRLAIYYDHKKQTIPLHTILVKDRLRKPFGHQELLIQCFILLSTKLKKRVRTALRNKEGI